MKPNCLLRGGSTNMVKKEYGQFESYGANSNFYYDGLRVINIKQLKNVNRSVQNLLTNNSKSFIFIICLFLTKQNKGHVSSGNTFLHLYKNNN